MHYLIVKYLVTAFLVVAISELARDNIRVAAVVAALPLVTTLALIWMYIEQQPPERLVSFAYYTFWYVLPTLPVFLVFSKKEYRKRGSASGRAMYDDPRVAVGPLVLAESERERRRSQHGGIRHGVESLWEHSAGVRSGAQYGGEADAGRARAAAGNHLSPIVCS